MSRTLLIQNGIIVTLGEKNRVLRGHALLCEDGIITRIGPRRNFRGKYGRVIDASGMVVLPGFINAHMHFYSTMVRGLGKAETSRDFTEVLEHLWWRLDKKLTLSDTYCSALLPLIDSVRRGTTTLIDHHASPYAARGSLDRIARAVKEVGLRACLCYELSDRDGPDVAQAGLQENVAFIERCARENDPQLKALFGLHASFTLGDETLAAAAEAGRARGAGFHIHVAEAQSDQDSSQAQHGLRVVERLSRFGILGPKTIAAHCVHVDGHEIELLRDSGTAVVHNPQSNMNNAVGVADLVKLSAEGVLVGLGTDAMTVNMLEEVRVALWAQHLARRDPSAGFAEALSALLFNNARIANRYWDPKIGALQEGYAADLILMDYQPPTPFDESTILGHVCFGLSQSFVDTTICGGRVLMERKKLKIGIDEAQVAARSLRLATQLWRRF